MLVDVDGTCLCIFCFICNGVDTYKKVIPSRGNGEIMGSGTEDCIGSIKIFVILITAHAGTRIIFI